MLTLTLNVILSASAEDEYTGIAKSKKRYS